MSPRNGHNSAMNGHATHLNTMPDPSWYTGIRDLLASQPKWTEPNERALLEPYEYLDANPGHNVRSKLIDTLNWWLKVPKEKLKLIDETIRMLHTSSLMIDDIEDGSELRRGRPSSHMVYGTPLTINAANYVYFLGLQELITMSDLKVPGHTPLMSTEAVQHMLIDEMINLHRGQGMDLYLRENFICPSEEEYIQMANNKTGGLFRVALKLMIGQSTRLRSATDGDAIIPLINLIGLQYQIRDDYMNLRSGDYTQNKGYCDDLSEGKFSFPLIHAITASRLLAEENRNGPSTSMHSRAEDLSTELKTRMANLPIQTNRAKRECSDDSEKETNLSRSIHVLTGSPKEVRTPHYDSPLEPASPSPDGLVTLENGKGNPLLTINDHEGFLKALRERPKEANKKRAIVQYMQNHTNSFHYTCQVLLHVDRQVRHELRKVERTLDEGRPNEHLRAYVSLLRSGWYRSPDCPQTGNDTPYEEL